MPPPNRGKLCVWWWIRFPEAQREVLDLYYWAELTLPEIARALNRNLNTVKYQFYRGHDLVAQGMAGMERMAAVSAAKTTSWRHNARVPVGNAVSGANTGKP